jgi:hypothetical protein
MNLHVFFYPHLYPVKSLLRRVRLRAEFNKVNPPPSPPRARDLWQGGGNCGISRWTLFNGDESQGSFFERALLIQEQMGCFAMIIYSENRSYRDIILIFDWFCEFTPGEGVRPEKPK